MLTPFRRTKEWAKNTFAMFPLPSRRGPGEGVDEPKKKKQSAVRSTSFYIVRIVLAYGLLTWLLARHGIGPALLAPNEAMGMATAVLAAVYLVVRLQLFLIVPGMSLRLIWLWCSRSLVVERQLPWGS